MNRELPALLIARRQIKIGILTVGCGFFIIFSVFFFSAQQRTSTMLQKQILDYSESLAHSSEKLQDFLFLQRELERFVGTLHSIQSVKIKCEIIIDGRPVAVAGEEPPSIFSRNFSRYFVSESGRAVKVVLNMDYFGLLWEIIYLFIAVVTVISILLLVVQKGVTREINRALMPLSEKLLKADQAEARLQLAEQVAHDIRSPVAALQVAMSLFGTSETEHAELANAAIKRIKEIADSILKQARSEKERALSSTAQKISLYDCLNELVLEKRAQFRTNEKIQIDFTFSPESQAVSPVVDESDFKRVISNLFGNALESLRDGGIVTISSEVVFNLATIRITDSGVGIPDEILARIGERGFTYGKANMEMGMHSGSGSGLGVFHAKEVMEKVGGSLKIFSEKDRGTIVEVSVPVLSLTK